MTTTENLIAAVKVLPSGTMPGRPDVTTLFVWADRYDYSTGEQSADLRYIVMTPDGAHPFSGNRWCSFGNVRGSLDSFEGRLDNAVADLRRNLEATHRTLAAR